MRSLNNPAQEIIPGMSIQDAIDEVEANGGGLVDIAPGTYVETVSVPSCVTIQGHAQADPNGPKKGTILQRPPGVDEPVISVEDSLNRVFTAQIRNLSVDGNKSSAGTGMDSYGIVVNDPSRIRIKDCSVYNCGEAGIRSNSDIVLWIIDVSARGCDGDGIFLSSTSDFTIRGCDVGSNGRHGILVTGDNGFIGGGTTSFLNGGSGIRVAGTGTRIVGARPNTNDGPGIEITGEADESMISGCHLYDNEDGINITDAMRTTIGQSVVTGHTNGIISTGTSDYTHVHGCTYRENTTDTDLVGANSSTT